MTDFTDDLERALTTAHAICQYSTEYVGRRWGMEPLLGWQRESIQALLELGGPERIEQALQSLSTQGRDFARAVGLLITETAAVRQHLDSLLDRWRTRRSLPRRLDRPDRTSAISIRSERSMGVLKTLLESFLDILGELIPGLKSVLQAVKEAIEHFS